MIGYYENHFDIKKDRLCPFKLHKATNSFSVPCNWHTNTEILLVTEGTGMIQYGTRHETLTAGDIIAVNSGVLHRPYSQTGIGYYCLIIDEGFCKENGLDVTVLHFEEKFRDCEAERLFMDIVDKMQGYASDRDALHTAMLRNAVLSLLIFLCRKHAQSENAVGTEKSSPAEKYIRYALEYLNEHYTEAITLDELAHLCGITKCHLAREFKRYTGQTVLTYVNSLRCQLAELYISEGLSVTDAAYKSGFESLSYFSRVYKRLMGVPPSQGKAYR